MRTNVRTFRLIAAVCLFVSFAAAQDTPAFFKQNCANCHTIGGGRLTGPDLKDVTARQDRAWLEQFIQNPRARIDAGDAYAQRMFQEARGVMMPTVQGMTPAMATALLDLVVAESKLPRSQFAGSAISDRPFTGVDVEQGRLIFSGSVALSGKGPSCVSCHTVRGLSGLSGGRLGPDLTLVYERLQGRKGLAAWLGAPASPIMTPVFKQKALTPEEILPLVAYFEDTAKKGGSDDSPARLNFFLMGLGAAVFGLVGLDAVWKRRLRGVRRPMVEAKTKGAGR